MIWLAYFVGAVIVCFVGVLKFGAPYLPTLSPQVEVALDLAELKPGETLLELGCGDGKILIAAAKRGINTVGYELNPLLALIAWLRTVRYRKQVRVIWGDFWNKPWPPAEAIFVFLLNRYMKKLDTKIVQLDSKPVKLVSFAFKVPDKRPSATKLGVYLYLYS
jgi:16S rRNA A1518/A1519 N6-dimethyltransferase RsmA/KsgA/DIM1 with predicted DNA glycosylase/AP lyase activity